MLYTPICPYPKPESLTLNPKPETPTNRYIAEKIGAEVLKFDEPLHDLLLLLELRDFVFVGCFECFGRLLIL